MTGDGCGVPVALPGDFPLTHPRKIRTRGSPLIFKHSPNPSHFLKEFIGNRNR
jgi:hypothetical protein